MKQRRRAATLAWAAAVAALVALGVLPGSAAVDDDPATTPLPEYDYADPAKSFVVGLDFGATSATLTGLAVGTERSYSHLGDPPLLRLVLTDDENAPGGEFDAWDPRWHFEETASGGEQLVVRPAPADLTVPFDADMASMLVRDQRAGTDLVTVDLRPAVREFCLANPGDPECVEADLAVVAIDVTGDSFGIVGAAVPVDVAAEVTNLGPDGPVDTDVTQTAVGSAGVSVTPTSHVLGVDGLGVGASSTVLSSYAVTCTGSGAQTVTFTSTVEPEKAKVVDLQTDNNSSSITFTVDCAVPVTVNVKPGSLGNPVNVREGAIPTALLTTAAGEYGNPLAFDASQIQATTVRIGTRESLVATNSGAPESHGRVHLEDVYELDEQTRDGDRDAMLHARAASVPVTASTTELCVRGRFGPGAGTSFFGCDSVDVVP